MKLLKILRRFLDRLYGPGSTVTPEGPAPFSPYPGCVLIPQELHLLEKIAEHGMGSVWRAHNSRRQKDVVVKFPLENTVLSAALFTTEANSAQSLKHPNIVEVYGIVPFQGTLFIEEELIVGKDFEAWRTEQTHFCFPWHEIKEYAIQVGKALAYAHERRICHRDVKPSNIMLAEGPPGQSRAKLIDFGIASHRSIVGNRSAISAGAHSLHYASPEQIGGSEPDDSDDVYSFCAMLYHLLTGCTLFDGIPGDPTHHIMYTAVPDPNKRLAESEVPFRIPPKVVESLLLGLRKDRGGEDGRPQDIMRIVHKLESAPEPTVLMGARLRWEQGHKETVRLASSGLIVIECLRESLALDDFFSRANLSVDCKRHPWDKRILQKIHERNLDGAVVNTWWVGEFLRGNAKAEIDVVCSCPSSMGGQCFYLVGAVEAFNSPVKFPHLRDALKGTTIFVNELPEHAQAVKVFLSTVWREEESGLPLVRSIDHLDPFQVLQTNPRGLVYCGQNFRLLAGQRQGFVEVVNFESCPPDLRAELTKFTENSFVVNRKFGEFAELDNLKAHCKEAQASFAKACKKKRDRREIIERISSEVRESEFTAEEMEDAINTAIVRTFSV
jgi:serine/threonine protein kinase